MLSKYKKKIDTNGDKIFWCCFFFSCFNRHNFLIKTNAINSSTTEFVHTDKLKTSMGATQPTSNKHDNATLQMFSRMEMLLSDPKNHAKPDQICISNDGSLSHSFASSFSIRCALDGVFAVSNVLNWVCYSVCGSI